MASDGQRGFARDFLTLAVLAALTYATGGLATPAAQGAFAARAALALGASSYARSQARKAGRRNRTGPQDNNVTYRTPDHPEIDVYGMARVPTVLVARFAHGEGNKYNTLVLMVPCRHRLTSIERVLFDGVDIGELDANGYVQSGSRFFTDRVAALSKEYAEVAVGGTLTLPEQVAQIIAVDTVAVRVTTITEGPEPELPRFTDTTLAEGEWSWNGNTVTILTDTATMGGDQRTLIVTYRAKQGGKAWVRVRKNLGDPAGGVFDVDGAGTTLTAATDGKWSATDKLCGIPNVCITFEFDPSGYMWAAGLPQVTLVAKGRTLYDPTKDSTNGGSGFHRFNDPATWEWSQCAVLGWSDYMVRRVGCGFDEIDWAAARAAVPVCNAAVTLKAGGAEPAFTANGYISTATDWPEAVEMLAMTMIGHACYSGGLWTILPFAWEAPTLTLPPSSVCEGDIETDPRPGLDEAINCVRGRFLDTRPTTDSPVHGLYTFTDFPPHKIAEYVTQDEGREWWHDIDLPLTVGAERAQRMARHYCYRARNGASVRATFDFTGYQTRPGRRIRLPWPHNSWDVTQDGGTGKVFQVLERGFEVPHRTTLLAQDDASAYYAWDYNVAVIPDPTPQTGFAPANFVEPPMNVRWKSDSTTFLRGADGRVRPYLSFTFDRPANPSVRVSLFWKPATQSAWNEVIGQVGDTELRAMDVSPGDVINAYLVAYNGIGAPSDPAWAMSITVNAQSATGLVVVAPNMVTNAGLDVSTAGWTLASSGLTPGSGLYLQRHPTPALYTISGYPSSANLSIESAQTGDGPIVRALSDPFTAGSGERWCAYAWLIGYGTHCGTTVVWYDEADNVIGRPIDGNLVLGGLRNPAWYWTRPEHYEQSVVFATAPSRTVKGRIAITAAGGWAAVPTKFVTFHKPFAGRVPFGLQAPPPWGPGGRNVINELMLMDGSAGDTFTKASGIDFALPVNRCDTPLLSATMAEIRARAGDRITYTFEATVSSSGGGNSRVRVGLVPTLFTDPFGQPKRSSDWLAVPEGATDFPVSRTDSFVYSGPPAAGSGKVDPVLGLYASVAAGTAALHAPRLIVQIQRR